MLSWDILKLASDEFRQEWTDFTMLMIACAYIDNQKQEEAFLEFCREAAAEQPTDDTIFCAEDDDEAVCFTALGTPLCERCLDAYKRGQEAPDAEIIMIEDDLEDGDDHSADEAIFCAVDICDCEAMYYALVDGKTLALCPMCKEDFKLGQASPDSAIYDLDQVRVRYVDGVYTIVETLQATANGGFEWQPYTLPAGDPPCTTNLAQP